MTKSGLGSRSDPLSASRGLRVAPLASSLTAAGLDLPSILTGSGSHEDTPSTASADHPKPLPALPSTAHAEPMLPAENIAPSMVVNAMQRLQPVHHTDREKIWLSQRQHVAQALRSVLQTANDTLTMVPFASLVLNGATRAIKTFEVLYPLLCMIMNLSLLGFQQTVWKGEAVAIRVAQQLRQVILILLQHYQDIQDRLGSPQGDHLRKGIQAFAW
jgi:hypothetical protein